MKRMYVTLGIMFLLVFWAVSSLGQNSKTDPLTPEEEMMQRLQKRNEMHQKILQNFFDNFSADQEKMFEDMEELMDGALGNTFSAIGKTHFQSQWNESTSGRTLIITPQSPEQKLDIEIKNGMVTVKGKSETKSAQGTSISEFNNSFSVPGDCDAAKAKMNQVDGKIHIEFPYRTAEAIQTKEPVRKPLPPSDSNVAI